MNQKNYLRNPIRALYEDEGYIIFDKPPGLLVIPTPKAEDRTLVNIVNIQHAPRDSSAKLHPCHRLDRETSGAIIFAKGKRHQRLMMDLFKERAVTKTYIAFIQGHLQKARGEIKAPIQHLDQKKFRKSSPHKDAITRYQVLERKKKWSIVRVQLITGRTNQIRIHFSKIKHPLIGDRKYSVAKDYPLKFRRSALHAQRLMFVHPMTGKKVDVESALAEDMQEFCQKN